MATHLEEEAQVEALKCWWKANGSSIIAGVVLGLAGIFGWNTWQNHQRTQAQQSSQLYSQLLGAVEQKQYELAEGIAQRLTSEYGKTAYADFARLFQAKVAVEKGQLEEAKKSLGMLLTSSHDINFRHIARMRQARVFLAMGNPDDGLKVLSSGEAVNPGRFAGQYEEIKGDLYYALGKIPQAREAYRKAIALGRTHAWLETKLNDLAPASSVDK